MTKLSNAKKSAKSVQTVEINTVDVAADAVASTLVKRTAIDASDKPVTRIALDASDLNANAHSFAGAEIDYALESTLDAGETVQTEESRTVDPLAPYADQMVKLAYVFEVMGMELDIRMVKGSVASVTASEFANAKDGPGQPVIIRCATSGAEIMKVYPVKGARNVTVVSGNRQTSTRTVKGGMSDEERQRIEAERQKKEEERLARIKREQDAALAKARGKAEEKRLKLLVEVAGNISEISKIVSTDDTRFSVLISLKEQVENLSIGIGSADLDKLKEYLGSMIKLAQTSKDIAKAFKANANHPKMGTDNFEQFKLFSEEHGLTCMEGNHAMNVIKNRSDSNYGWKQKGKDFAEDYNKVLIGKFRVCAVAYAKTGKTDKSMKEAMRLVDKAYDENGNVTIPDGWYVIQD